MSEWNGEHRVLVLQMKRVLWMDGGDDSTIM